MEQKANTTAADTSTEEQAFEKESAVITDGITSATDSAYTAGTESECKPAHEVQPADDASAAAQKQAPSEAQQQEPSTAGTALFKTLAYLGPVLPIFCAIAFVWPWGNILPLDGAPARLTELASAFPSSASSLYVFADGSPVADVSIVTIWFMQASSWLWNTCGLTAVTGIDAAPAVLFSAAMCLASALAVIALWFAALTFTHSARSALAASLIYVTTLGINVALRTDIDAVLFTASGLAALTLLFSGYVRECAPVRLVLGFLFTTIAFATGGLLGLLIPLIVCIFFLLWRGAFHRTKSLDGVIAFGLMLALIFGRMLVLFLTTDGSAVMNAEMAHHAAMLGTVQTDGTFFNELLNLVPWILIVPFLPWSSLFKAPRACWKNRTENPAAGWMWLAALISGAALIFCMPYASMIAPLFGAIIACMLGNVLMNMSAQRARMLCVLIGAVMLISALLLASANFIEFTREYIPAVFYAPSIAASALFMAAACAVGGLVMILPKRISAAGGLMLTTLVCIALSVAIALFKTV